MKKIEQVSAKGYLGEVLRDLDEMEQRRTENRMLMALRISNALKRLGMSQREFALRMGRSATVVSEWLSGDRNFTIDTLSDIGGVLGIDLLNMGKRSRGTSGSSGNRSRGKKVACTLF